MLRRRSSAAADLDLATLQQRVAHQQAQGSRQSPLRSQALQAPDLQALPQRYLLHTLVALLLPLSLVLSPALTLSRLPEAELPWLSTAEGDATLSAPPIALRLNNDRPVPDAAFAAIDALPQPALPLARSQAQAPLSVRVAVREAVNLRNGPGSDYDSSGQAQPGEQVLLIGRQGDWLQARTASGNVIWLAAEAVDASLAQLGILREPSTIPAPPPPKIAIVSDNNLSLRDGPGAQYVGIAKLAVDQDLTLLARYVSGGDDWFQVLYGQQTGWVSSAYLRFQPGVAERITLVDAIPDPQPALVGSISGDTAALRQGPGTSFARQGTLRAGAQLDLLGRHSDWFKVRSELGEGWVFGELINVSDYVARRVPQLNDVPVPARPQARPAAPAPAAPAVPAEPAVPTQPEVAIEPPAESVAPAPAAFSGDIVAFGMQFIGTPYAWGGESPAGFDCSGFTRYVYGQVGLNLPHNAAAQYSTAYGAAINDVGSLAPGDLVFFANTYQRGISHVGIYVGGGNVVQALSPGYGVGVASLYEGYWAEHFYGAIRPGL